MTLRVKNTDYIFEKLRRNLCDLWRILSGEACGATAVAVSSIQLLAATTAAAACSSLASTLLPAVVSLTAEHSRSAAIK